VYLPVETRFVEAALPMFDLVAELDRVEAFVVLAETLAGHLAELA
jgi:hypothetical protein